MFAAINKHRNVKLLQNPVSKGNLTCNRMNFCNLTVSYLTNFNIFCKVLNDKYLVCNPAVNPQISESVMTTFRKLFTLFDLL